MIRILIVEDDENISKMLAATLSIGDYVAGTHPALTLVYHITPEQAALRMAARGAADRMEAKGMAFQERVYQGFCAIAAEEPARVKLIDATAPIEDVFAQTVEQVRAYGLDVPQDAVVAALAQEAE